MLADIIDEEEEDRIIEAARKRREREIAFEQKHGFLYDDVRTMMSQSSPINEDGIGRALGQRDIGIGPSHFFTTGGVQVQDDKEKALALLWETTAEEQWQHGSFPIRLLNPELEDDVARHPLTQSMERRFDALHHLILAHQTPPQIDTVQTQLWMAASRPHPYPPVAADSLSGRTLLSLETVDKLLAIAVSARSIGIVSLTPPSLTAPEAFDRIAVVLAWDTIDAKAGCAIILRTRQPTELYKAVGTERCARARPRLPDEFWKKTLWQYEGWTLVDKTLILCLDV